MTDHRWEMLLREVEGVRQSIRSVSESMLKLATIGTSILSIGAVLGLADGRTGVVLALPFAAGALILYGLLTLQESSALGAYKRFLEEMVNHDLGERLALWESLLARRVLRPSITNKSFMVLYGVLYVVLGWLSVQKIIHYRGADWVPVQVLVSVGLFLMTVLLGVGAWEAYRAGPKAYEVIKTAHPNAGRI